MSTPILPFARWLSGTNQNSIPANDNALRAEILQRLVLDDATTAQPGSPDDGDLYIIPAGATGAQWSTFDEDDLAIFYSGTWYAFAPVDGVVVHFDGELRQWTTSGGWEAVAGGGGSDPLQSIIIACSDETTDLTTGTAKVTFRMPYAFDLLPGAAGVRASLTGAPSGSTLIADINEGGSSILSTKLSVDAGEKTSTTAATPAVISDTSLADDAEITIDIDQIGSSSAGKGLKIALIGRPA